MAEEKKNGGEPANDENGGNKPDNQPKLEDLQAQIEALKAEKETLKSESSGKDKKLAQLLKEKEEKELANKSAEEQAALLKQKIDNLEKVNAFKSKGLDDSQCLQLVAEKDPYKLAEMLANMIETAQQKAMTKAVEDFKSEQLKKVPPEPNPKNSNTEIDPLLEKAKLAAMGEI